MMQQEREHCQKVFIDNRANFTFCSPRRKNLYGVYKSRGKKSNSAYEEDGDL